MLKRSLRELYADHTGKISDKWSLYLTEYDRLFAPMADLPVRMLEIGVQNGGSLEIWSDYFRNATAIVGCDINPDCERLTYDDPRISVVVGDANTADAHEKVMRRSPQFDIVIDDGSHRSSDIVKSFALYFPHIADGGLFVAEDLHCSYWGIFEGGLFDPHSSIAFFKRLADVINHEHWGIPKARTEILRGIFGKYDFEIAEETLSLVHSIEFINSMCVVRKAAASQNGLNRRIISGADDLIVPSSTEWHDVPYQLDPIFDESRNSWPEGAAPPDEMLPELKRALAESAGLASRLQQQNGRLINEISTLRNSLSWRMTELPRLAASLLRRAASDPKGGGIAKLLVGAARRSLSRFSSGVALQSLQPREPARIIVLRYGHRFYRKYLKPTSVGRLIGRQVLKSRMISLPAQTDGVIVGNLAGLSVSSADSLDVEVHSRVPGFHLSPPLNFEVHDELASQPKINVLLPSLRLKNMSGGPNTALLLAAMLSERGEQVRLIACDAALEGEEAALLPYMESLMRRKVARERIEIVDGFDRSRPLPIGVGDVFLATAWWTAQIARYGVAKTSIKTFIYLIQDFEPILHEGSTFQARALETYNMPHIPVINTKLLLDHLVREGAGRFADPAFAADALWFSPALDRTHYFPAASQSSKKVLLFYARPSIARRNLFELGLVALRRAVASGAINKDDWEVWAIGEKLPPIALGEGVMLNPLPWMSFDDYARRVRTADLLLSLMLSPHPSYPPLEMAASGKLVVTNSFSVKTAERLRAISPNIIVAEPNAESIGQAIENAAGRINCGLPSYDSSGAIALPTDWDQSLNAIVSKLLARLEGLREPALEPGQPVAPGMPSVPKSDYETYRKTSLARRRRDGMYGQTPGLLSFVTSAYNTDPRFLEELGNSVFLQDGGMHFEWLILDNGSTEEGTCRALARLARHRGVRLERVESNLGIIGGMRYCLERASGRYILPLDSDDLIERDCVNVLTRFLQENNYPPAVYTDEDKVDGESFREPYFKPDWDPVLFLHSCYIAHLCVIDRAIALELQLYSDKSAEGCHDWDSFIKFMNAGFVPLHVPEVLYSWRMHNVSTSANIASKSYITRSHSATLQRALAHRDAPHLKLVTSPLFNYNVDWWYRRERTFPVSCETVQIAAGSFNGDCSNGPLRADSDRGLQELADRVAGSSHDLVHLIWDGVVPDNDEWSWDSAGVIEMFSDAVMVGGVLHDKNRIVDGPRIFGFGEGYDCPDRGRPLTDPGYSATIWKAHSVSAVSSGHCVVRRDFLLHAMPMLLSEKVPVCMIGPWLGALAAEQRMRILFSPFMAASAAAAPEDWASEEARANFLSRFWSQFPDTRFYSQRFGLTLETAYSPVSDPTRDSHMRALQQRTLPYEKWLALELRCRAARYPKPARLASISILTPVYSGSDLDLLDELARAIASQTVAVAQWLLIVNGPMPDAAIARIRRKADGDWKAQVIVESKAVGIVAALRLGLEAADSDYVVPVDADDLITSDAIQILVHEIDRKDRPEFLFSDEDMLVEDKPIAPYLRASYDPVLSFENSTIWHLCAIKRDTAFKAGIYSDPAANWCQDWDSVSRITGCGGRIEHVPEVLYHWRHHSGSTTNNAEGDVRSLDSVRHILERHIARCARPERFEVAEWPESRGARELYIARKTEHLPQLIWIGDATSVENVDPDAVLVFAASGVMIQSQLVAVEVARLLELHPTVGAVGGIVVGPDDFVVDGCCMVNRAGTLESPWQGRRAAWAGPYALALKPQTVATTGSSLAFFRAAALKRAGLWPPEMNEHSPYFVRDICLLLAKDGWTTAFSPLVRARGGLAAQSDAGSARPLPDIRRESQALVRYGTALGHRN
jgi:O-antigen biosynthesis protein